MSNSRLKESNIEWLGKIPKNWKLMHNKYLLKKKKSIISKYNNEKILSLTMNGVIERDLTAGGKMPSSFNGYQKLEKGNLLLCLFDIDVTPRCVGIIPTNGITSPAYSQFILNKGKANLKYYYYYFLMLDNQKTLVHLSKNLRNTLSEQEFGNLISLCPPLKEQKQIADFLDKKVSQIDDISKKIQQEITDLEEYRKSIITKAVTKGLNPNVPMKDSGIPWIGKMPENWKLERVKLITTSLNKGISPNYIIAKGTPIITQAMFSQGYLNFHNIKYGSDPFELNQKGQVKSEDILFATTGGGVLGKVFFVDQIEKGYLASADVCIIRTNNKVFSSKLLYYIFSINYNLFNGLMATGSTNQIHLNMFQFKNMHIPVMPKTDQKKILKFIDQKASKINKLIDKKHKILDFLNQYKQSIIYEYVTGKKQVPTEEGAKK